MKRELRSDARLDIIGVLRRYISKREFRRIGDFRKYEYEDDPINDKRTVVQLNEEKEEIEQENVDKQKVNEFISCISTIGSGLSVKQDLYEK